MSVTRDDSPVYTGMNSGPQPLAGDGAPARSASGWEYLAGRARERATDAAYDLFRALRAGDVSSARWLLDAVYGQVASLPGGASPPQ